MASSDLAQEHLSKLSRWLYEWSCQQQLVSAEIRKPQVSSPLLNALGSLAFPEDPSYISEDVRTYANQLLTTLKLFLEATRTGSLPDLSTHLNIITTQVIAGDEEQHLLTLGRWWLLALGASILYAYTLDSMLDAAQPLSEALTYWRWRVDRRWLAGLSLLQTAPHRIYTWTHQILHAPKHLGAYTRQWIYYLPRRPVQGLLAYAQREAELKCRHLSQVRYQRATALGYLAERGICPAEQPNNDDPLTAIQRFLAQLLDVMEQATQFAQQDVASSTSRPSSPESSTLTLDEAYHRILASSHSLDKLFAANQHVLDLYGPPSFLTRYWPILGAGFLLGPWILSTLYHQRYTIRDWIRELGITARRFLTDWVWQPIRNIYETIRHREPRLAIMGKASLSSDLASLERMVLDLARESGHFTEAELEMLTHKVRDGDLSVVLRQYEQEIKTPLKSALFDNLIRVLLIQIQKGKVDLELAMTALDKLLHANELNFAFLTAAPVLLITYGIVRWLRAIWQRRRGLSVGTARHEARIWLRRTERLLNRHLIPTSDTAVHGGLAYQPHGLLLCNTHALRNLLPHLGLSEELRREWLIDLREVEESRWTTVQRLNTIHRMYRTYGFLLSN